MKILQLCNKSPYPAKEGGPIAMNNITRGLLENNHEVKILAVNTPKYFVKKEDFPLEYKNNTQIETVFINNSINVFCAFFNLFSSKSYNIQRFISKDFDEKLIEVLQKTEFDIVHLESLFMAPYLETIRKYSKAKIVLRSHNIEHLIWERMTLACKNPLKKAYLNLLTKRLKKYEIGIINSFDGIAAITNTDADYLRECGCKIPILDLPVGIYLNDIPIKTESISNEFNLFHLGTMNWMPNIEGIEWFLEECWMEIHEKFPEIKLYLAGRHMPGWLLKSSYPNVIVIGEVSSSNEFMLSKSVMIVPLKSGSGIRVKIIEGMSLGKAVISTTVGAEGIDYTEKEDILIANNSGDFIEAIQFLKEKEVLTKIENNAKILIETKYNNVFLAKKLINFYNSLD
ncbi:MAG: glycosyltransferase [Bacteroidetes bacterium]|nr:glycosyltransferase [Bacteroidota bacterium]